MRERAERYDLMSSLGVVSRLLDMLHNRGIRYCHWKSNAHLNDSVSGHADLDILVDYRQASEVQAILAFAGYRRISNVFSTRYPAIEDFIALDADAGRLSHCHVHYRLVLGERLLKGYRVPWEELVLSTRQWRPDVGIFVAEPAIEMILLILRGALKLRTRDHLLRLVGARYADGAMKHEFEWLRARIDPARCIELCKRELGEEAAHVVEEILALGLTPRRLTRFRRAARATLSRFRIFGPFHSRLVRWLREMAWTEATISTRYLHLARLRHRVLPTGGVRVAFVGADGSGKSSLCRDVEMVFSKKLDVVRIYFGSGDGPASWFRWPLRLLLNVVRRLRGGGLRTRSNEDTNGGGQARALLAGKCLVLAKAFWALVLSLEKRQKLRAAWMASNRGALVIADRYPQAQVVGFNDGPLLHRWMNHPNPLLRSLARWEAAPYEWAEACPPDLVFRLNVSAEAALKRKSSTSWDEVQRRIAAVRSITFRPPAITIEIDADLPYDQVRRVVLKEIWEHL